MNIDCVNCGKANRPGVAICYSCNKAVSIKQKDMEDIIKNKRDGEMPDFFRTLFKGFEKGE